MKRKDGSQAGSKSASKAASRAGSACSQFSTHSKRSLKGDHKVLQSVRFFSTFPHARIMGLIIFLIFGNYILIFSNEY